MPAFQSPADPTLVAPRAHDDEDAKLVKPTVVDASKTDRLNPPTEYDVLELGDLEPDELKKRLNELGAEGWALIATTPAFIFRRMKKSEEEKPRARVGFGL